MNNNKRKICAHVGSRGKTKDSQCKNKPIAVTVSTNKREDWPCPGVFGKPDVPVREADTAAPKYKYSV